MNLRPSVWGPPFWLTIHIIALAYPATPTYSEKKAAKEFFESLLHLLPCPTCREHYAEHTRTLPLVPHLDTRDDLFKWTLELHNAVNRSLGKPAWTAEEVITYISRLGERDRSPIISAADFAESDNRSLVKGFILGGAVAGALAAASYFIGKQ
jgi:hypothetical protein